MPTKEQIEKDRTPEMEARYVELWYQELAPGVIIKRLANDFFLSESRIRELIKPMKLRKKHNLKR